MEKVEQDWSRKRLGWNVVRAYSEAGRNRGILEHSKERMRKRERAHATRQLSMPGCRHCSQHCINVNPMACKVFDGNQDYPTDRWGNNRETKPSVPCTWMTEMSSKAGLLSPESVLSVTALRSLSHWYAGVKATPRHWLRARATPRYPDSCLSCFIPPITKLSVENIYAETEGEILSIF